ncbi:transporter [Halobacteriales archaeon QS_6_71_20]|nr:MAG: transporter [Halobacteriales archaeon QS_6_71_20]
MAFTHLPLRRSALVGAAAYGLGYLPAYAVAAANRAALADVTVPGATENIDPASLSAVFGSLPPSWTLGGWLFYNAHRAAVSLPAAGARNGVFAPTNTDLIAALGGSVLGLYLVPPALLVAAGALAMEWGEIGSTTPWVGGASVAVGYAPLLVLGSFVFAASIGDGAVTVVGSPDGLTTLLAALVYPTVFGALGGALAVRRRSAEVGTATT